MSGIVGILHGDGQPIDPALLQTMTELMAFRGPDARDTWTDGYVGFGHALLRTTWESATERQPHSLDGKVWITGDIRLDWREDLIDQLRASRRNLENDVTDVDLVLHAYQVWGDACLERLSGDFALAIWDGPQQRLFCARDHFGVVPFFYATIGKGLIFSNTLNCLRLHPEVSDRLNEGAIPQGSAKGLLPESVRQRPKTTLRGFAHYNWVQQSGIQPWMSEILEYDYA